MVSSKVSVFIPKEIKKGETRVSATPITVKNMIKAGISVYVESGAGDGSFISDQEYKEVGAEITKDSVKSYASSDIILVVNPPEKHRGSGKHQFDMLKNKACWISMSVPQNE